MIDRTAGRASAVASLFGRHLPKRMQRSLALGQLYLTAARQGRASSLGHHVPTHSDRTTAPSPRVLARAQVALRIVFDSWRAMSLRMQTTVAQDKPRLYFVRAGLAEEIATREGHRDGVSAM
jgi:hypothetical protein